MKIKILSVILCICLLTTEVQFYASAIEPISKITGETSRTNSEITLSDGTKTGVKYTNIKLSGYYGNNREINIAEADLSNTNLSLEVINCGTYVASAQTMNKAAVSYNNSHAGQTVLAAVNGDLWMTAIHSNSAVTTNTLYATRGVLIVDGEIWASQQVDQENICATNFEQGTPAVDKNAFGVTDLNQPIIGVPEIYVSLDIGGESIKADGLNRLPAIDSIMVYNHRINSSNYALNDSYEVELIVHKTSALTVGGSLTATIKKIYEPGSTTRPSLANEDTIVLTARGSRIDELKNACAVGKRVTISASLIDKHGNTELWQNVKDAVSGHMHVLRDGTGAPIPDNTYYPTTLIGYKDDGTVALATVTSTKDKSRAALKISQSYELCKELGYNNVFFLDGGGSATFVTLDAGSYTVRNKCSDGSARAVINGVGFVWNDEPVCMRQGTLNHMKVPADLASILPTYMDGALLSDLMVVPNCTDIGYDSEEEAFCMAVNTATNDPFATLDFTKLKRVNAEDYPYIVLRVKATKNRLTKLSLFYSCGDYYGASGDRLKTVNIKSGADWQYVIVNMGYLANWSGYINNIRVDIYDSENSTTGDAMYISSVALCRSEEEATKAVKGWISDEACTNYAELVDSLKPTPYFIAGDVNGDGNINLMDSFRMKMYIKNIDSPERAATYAGDVNGDGLINLMDVFELKYRVTRGTWRY